MADAIERLNTVENNVERIMHDLYSNGQPGFLAEARSFFTRADERAKNEKDFHEQRDKEIAARIDARERRFNHLTVIAGLLFTLMLVGIGWLTLRDMRRTSMEQTPAIRVSSSQQNAGGTETPPH